MRTIWKFPFEVSWEEFTLTLPYGFKVVKVAQSHVWIEGHFDDENYKNKKVCFKIIGTGHEILLGLDHVGTWFEPPFVWHLYQERLG